MGLAGGCEIQKDNFSFVKCSLGKGAGAADRGWVIAHDGEAARMEPAGPGEGSLLSKVVGLCSR